MRQSNNLIRIFHGRVSCLIPSPRSGLRSPFWGPIYGDSQIQGEAPFRAVLHGGVWTVAGTLPPGMVGGVAIAELAKSDARVLRVAHGK